MDKPSFKLVGAPCGAQGQYTFYKAIRVSGKTERVLAIGDFFFVRIWQDSELVSIGELQLVWTDRVSEQTLVSLRLYFLPENTPQGRGQHGEHEVLVINEKVVLKAEDLLSWVWSGSGWETGLRAVWRGACATPPPAPRTEPLTCARIDFADVDQEKATIEEDPDQPAVVVFSYPRYCRYRGVVSRLEGLQAGWLRDSLVAALGGYAAPSKQTSILYCKDTFEYPELEGHEFVCNHLAPRVKGRPRGRRRRLPGDHSDTDDNDKAPQPVPRRLSLRNGLPEPLPEPEPDSADQAFLQQLANFYRDPELVRQAACLHKVSLRSLYESVVSRGGYEAVCRHKLWRALYSERPSRIRAHYERYLLPFELHSHKSRHASVDVKMDDIDETTPEHKHIHNDVSSGPEKRLRTPSPPRAAELNRQFLLSLEQPRTGPDTHGGAISSSSSTSSAPAPSPAPAPTPAPAPASAPATPAPAPTPDKHAVNGHAHNLNNEQNKARPVGRSSLRHVRVKPTRQAQTPTSIPSADSSSPPAPPRPPSDDEIVEVPYKPKTPEIIDLDEYPESPQAQVKKKKLDILKEGGLEVTPVPPAPPAWGLPVPLMGVSPPLMLNPAMQHQIMTQASIFQMYNIIPQNYANGIQPPRVIQATCVYGSSGPEKTVYGNPKDPFMPPPHILLGTPIKPQRIPTAPIETRPDVLDLTCKSLTPPQKPAVEIVRIPSSPSPSKTTPQNLSKNYTLVDGKAVVGSNLEITLVNPKNAKNRPPQKRSSNGQFIKTKTPTPPKDYPKPYSKKPPIIVPNYSITGEDISPTSSTSSSNSQVKSQEFKSVPSLFDMQKSSIIDMQKSTMLDMQKSAASMLDMQKSAAGLLDMQKSAMLDMQKSNFLEMQKSAMLDMQKSAMLDMQKSAMLDMHKSRMYPEMHKLEHKPSMLDIQKSNSMFDMQKSAANILEMQKTVPNMPPFMDPLYMSALYSSLGQMDQRQLAMYRELMTNQFKGYSGLLGSVTPTTKN